MSQTLKATQESFTALKSWPEYQIETKKFLVNKNDTGLQAIYKNGNFVKMLSQKYEVIPNEDVVKVTDAIASKITLEGQAAVPLTKMEDHQWFHTKPNNHVITNSEQTQAIAMYVFPKKYDVGGKSINLGFIARNSIDGKWAFSASLMSFRQICQNVMMHLARSRNLTKVSDAEFTLDIQKNQIQNITSVSKRHTKALGENDLELVKSSIEGVIESGLKTIEQYRNLVNLKMNQEVANTIAKYVPKSITKELDWISLDDKTKVNFDQKATQWDAFNDITENLTHEGTNFRRTLRVMEVIDRTFGTSV